MPMWPHLFSATMSILVATGTNLNYCRHMSNVEHIKSFSDASGAPAVVSCGSYRFAFDTLGEVTCTLVRPVYGSRREGKIALSVCRRAYLAARDAIVTPEWLAQNARMYADA